jgi:phage gp16-like protein
MMWDVSTDLPSNDENSILTNLVKNLDKMDKTKVNRGNEQQSNASKKCNIGKDSAKGGKGSASASHATRTTLSSGRVQDGLVLVALSLLTFRVL